MLTARVAPSRRSDKKFVVTLTYPDGRTRTVHFGARGYSDYTVHRDAERMRRYLDRHRARETWTRDGVATPGFWARWLLWSEPTLAAARRRVERAHPGLRVVLLTAPRTSRARRSRASAGRTRRSG